MSIATIKSREPKNNKFLYILFLLLSGALILVLHNFSIAQSNITKNAESGKFDYYVFAQAWYPTFCKGRPKGGCDDLSNYMKTDLAPHGLWPNLESKNHTTSYNTSCVKSPGCRDDYTCTMDAETIGPEVLAKIQNMMPTSLMNHEWKKHGTCTGLNQKEYFETILTLQNSHATPDFIKYNIGEYVTFNNIAQAFGGEKMVNIICKRKNKKQYLVEVHHFLDKNLTTIEKKYNATNNCKKNEEIYIATAESHKPIF
ncbi:ribonuclease T2 family protein [Candidatus Bandiella euplotis]|uniref:Ribonuclease T superfamily protein n=1 Tax=Candidatus Bandiella euplotis TaxID=1664265 RepID=A0ABZ0UKM7_9RICK|nr:hypothetical protein [Candidatus Bandiella woodruffii]WPX96274.1 Ribonuclease T superfamily protein [Candidatus Bandiella woodruffii]